MESYLLLEFWILLADQRLSKKTLTTLCLTSKTLNDVFRPVLYREIILPEFAEGDSLQWKYQQLRAISKLPIETHLRHTRRLDPNYVGGAISPGLSMCLQNMPNLKTCSIWTTPGSAAYFLFRKITNICLDLPRSISLGPDGYLWPEIPCFPSHLMFLHSLDLRNLKGDPDILGKRIAEILFNYGRPSITALGIGFDFFYGEQRGHDLFLRIAERFDDLKRASRITLPGLRLSLRDLVLGKGMYNWNNNMNDEKWQLSRLLDVSKLRTLRVLNDPNHGRIRRSAYENIDMGIFDGITALEELSMECYNQDALRLLLYLTSMKTFPTKQSCESFEQAISTNSFQVVQATQDPSGGSILKFPLVSRELVISLISNLDERFFDKPWNAPEYQWEELGVGYINWELHRYALLQLSNLRILMCTRATATLGGEPDQDVTTERKTSELANIIFVAFQEYAKKQGRISRLKYVGINGWVYAYLWLPISELNGRSSRAELVRLDKEEARAFEFIRINESLEVGWCRLGAS